MNTRPNDDEFDGIFDDLIPNDFTPVTTASFPAESPDFNEFVTARLEAARLAYAPGRSLSHAALSNGRHVRQLTPTSGENIGEYLQRLSLNARNMQAHSFFFCRIIDATGTVDDLGFCVLWIAHYLHDGEQILRSGYIPIENDELGDTAEAPHPELDSVIGQAFLHVLIP